MNTNRTIPDFIIQLVDAGIPVSLTKEGFQIEGFYKSGSVEIIPSNEVFDDDDWFAKARYNEISRIADLHDIVALNYQWWQSSKERWDGWKQPDEEWAPLLEQFGYVSKKTIPERIIYE